MDLSMMLDLELVKMQHDLRQHPEDKEMLDEVLKELGKRQKKNEKKAIK